MQTHSYTVLAVEGGGSLVFVVVGLVVVIGLLAMFVSGRRRAARRRPSTPAPPATPASGEAQRGTTWQTPDDDPAQGRPHR
ncbi:hypothetical protein GCM10010277_07910 [Streptomyces longisporoflavus]|uniref:DUF6479 family protein n=1 Tax=Streptomyces longisporoflavus TaxID=28044 RepID=UPI00167EA713|nr:DUF6479 family protein [Streptomyces longisporoflavus]GGV26356.1 hypothetical protein GCM10010277_07910 [Streptomyces longisporoflavus]